MLLVFGSLNADMLFKVEALPRPGETVLCPGYELAAGGKGANQAAAAAKAGADVHMIGHLGADSFGDFTRGVMVDAGVDCSAVATSKQATAIAVIGVDQAAENQIIVASGANLDTHPDQIASERLGPDTTVLCQNEILPDATFDLLKRANSAGARTLLNLAPAAALERGMADPLDFLIVNEIEAAMAVGQEAIGDDALAFATELGRKLDLTAVITLGADGAVAAGPGGRFKVSAASRSSPWTPPVPATPLSVSWLRRSIKGKTCSPRFVRQASAPVSPARASALRPASRLPPTSKLACMTSRSNPSTEPLMLGSAETRRLGKVKERAAAPGGHSSRKTFSRRSWRSWASMLSVAIGRASRRCRPIGSWLSSQ